MSGESCHQCSAPSMRGSPLRACARCKQAFYCNRTCQKQHWKTHKRFCHALLSAPSGKSPDLIQCSPIEPLSFTARDADAPLTPAQGPCPVWLHPTLITTIPPKYDDPARCAPGGYTACAIPAAMKFPILTQPGFPHPVPEPRAPALRVATVEGKRLGLFTTRDIDAGEVIFAERALLIVSSAEWCTTFAGNERGAEFRAHAIRDKEAVMKALVKTLPHEKRAAYRALPNVHPRDECGPLWGVARTNGSGIMPLLLAMVVPGMVEHEQLKFLGVCETLSHLNHSCRPNAALHFDLPSFAFMLHTVRSIPAGTEITGSYTDLLAPTAVRQAVLASFRFQCTCTSCVNSETSDRQRRELAKLPALEQTAMFPWLLNKGNLPDDYLTKPSLRALELLRQEGAEASTAYSMHLSQLCLAYAALGDRERYLDAHKRSVGLVQGIRPVKIEGFRDTAPAVPEMHPFWRVRVQGGPRSMQDLQAMLKSD